MGNDLKNLTIITTIIQHGGGEFFQVAWFGKVLDLCLLGYKGDSHFSEKSNIDHYRSSPRMC